MTPATYADQYPREPFPKPAARHPTNLHAGTTSGQREENREIRAVNAAADFEVAQTAVAKQHIWDSLDDLTRASLSSPITGNRLLTIKAILDGLIAVHGTLTAADIKAKVEKLSIPFDPASPTGMIGHVKAHEHTLRDLAAINKSVSAFEAYETFVQSLEACGLFDPALANFTMLPGYSLDARSLEGANGLYAFISRAFINSPARATSKTTGYASKLTTVADPTGTLAAIATLTVAVQGLVDAANKTKVARGHPPATAPPANGPPARGGAAPQFARTPQVAGQPYYCWTHGSKCSHYSNTCNTPNTAGGHQLLATFANRMGGKA